MGKAKRKQRDSKKLSKKSSRVAIIFFVALLAVTLLNIVYFYMPSSDPFPKVTWEESEETKVVMENDLVKDVLQIMISYKIDLDKAIEKRNISNCNIAYQNFSKNMIKLANKMGWYNVVYKKFYRLLSEELENYGWYFATESQYWNFDWGNFKVKNCRLGPIAKIQQGKVGKVEFQFYILKYLKTVTPSGVCGSTGEGKIILVEENLLRGFEEYKGLTSLEKFRYLTINHEVQHAFDQGTYPVTTEDFPILELRAILRTLADRNIETVITLQQIKNLPRVQNAGNQETYKLVFNYLDCDLETLEKLDKNEIRQKAREAFLKTNLVMEKLPKGE